MSNRIIKYQYWYGGVMLEVGQIEFMTDGSYRVNDELVGGVLREWTGLLDKNGKEIYEGDVVKSKALADVFEVKYEHGGYFRPTRVLEQYDYPLCELELEVIGNIYEDGHLLTNQGSRDKIY